MEIFYIFIFTVVATISTLGYGTLTLKYLKIDSNNIGLHGIMGLFLLTIFSSYSHILFPHNYIHNLIFISFGFLCFFQIKKDKSENIKLILLL